MSLQLIAYGIVSPLHLINFLAFWYSNKSHYNKVIIFIYFYWGYNIIPEKYLNFCKKNNIDIYVNESNKDEIIFNDKTAKSDLVFITNIGVKVLLKYKKQLRNAILIDEGLSTYAGFDNFKNGAKREKDIDVYFLPYLFKESVRYIVEKVFYRHNIVDFRAFSKRNGKMKDEYKIAVHQLFSFMYPNDINNLQENKVMIFCSQPFVDLKIMNEEDFSSYLLKIQDKVRERGFSLLVKKHPAEKEFNYEKYGLKVLDYDGIFEEYVFLHPIEGMISAMSTSSVLVPALYDVNSFIMDYKMVNELGGIVQLIFSNYSRSLDKL